MFKWLVLLVCGLLISACSTTANKPINTSHQVSSRSSPAINIPIVQDRGRPVVLSERQGAHLQSRQGYWVDRSLNTQGQNERIQFLVIHYTASDNQRAIDLLTRGKVGVHYLVTSQPPDFRHKPVVYQLADESKRAWHAGLSAWGNRENLNDTSIGIEIVNKGYANTPSGRVYFPYSESQIELVIALARDIVNRYDILPTNVVGHSDIAPGRKVDPGPFFPWQKLYQAGIGAWPDAEVVQRYSQQFSQGHLPGVLTLQRALATYGYSIHQTGVLDDQTKQVLISFQMHFRPGNYSGKYDVETAAILFALIAKYDGQQTASALLQGK